MQDHAAKDAFNASSPTADYYAGKTIFVTGATYEFILLALREEFTL